MMKYLIAAGVWVLLSFSASAQTPPTMKLCFGNPCVSVNAANPLPVTATVTPSGTQNVNLTQILGAAPSLTNPIWVFPATGATFPISGTVTTAPPANASTNITQWNSVGIGSPSNYGTSPGAVLVPGVNAFVTNSVAVTGAFFQATQPVSGTVTVTEPTTTNVASTSLEANHIINAAASSLYSFNVSADSTLSGAAWWIMIYNATTAPADGAVTPARCYAMTSGTTSFSAAFPVGLPFSTGIVIGASTTGCFTKTASTHAFIAGDYK